MSRTPTMSTTSPVLQVRRTTTGGLQKVSDITERRHLRFNLYEKHWRFLYESYVGGPEYLFKGAEAAKGLGRQAGTVDLNSTNLFRYVKEGPEEYTDRLMRAHRKNYSRKVVDQIRSFIARKPPVRQPNKLPKELEQFWKESDVKSRKIDRVMALTLQWALVFGGVWVQVEKAGSEEVFVNYAEELERGMPYIRFWFPFDVLDAGFDNRGELKWILVRELRREDDDPMAGTAEKDYYMLWEPNRVRTFVKTPPQGGVEGTSASFQLTSTRETGLGRVPFKFVPFTETANEFVASGLLDDIAYLDRTVFNQRSQLDTMILDQTFSQLAMPADAVLMNAPERAEGATGGVDSGRQMARQRIMEMGTKRVFLYNGQTNHPPAYISPDATQVDAIRAVIRETIEEIYRLAGLLGDVGRPAKTQSGVSKAYDFDRLNKLLTFAAQELESAEYWIAEMVLEWMRPPGTPPFQQRKKLPDDLVGYPENFDIMGILEELDIAFRADELDLYSPTAQGIIRKRAVFKMLPHLEKSDRDTIEDEIDLVVERNIARLEKEPLDPLDDPDMDPGRDDPDNPDGNQGDGATNADGSPARGVRRREARETTARPSESRGRGGGARGPRSGRPTRPTQQRD